MAAPLAERWQCSRAEQLAAVAEMSNDRHSVVAGERLSAVVVGLFRRFRTISFGFDVFTLHLRLQ